MQLQGKPTNTLKANVCYVTFTLFDVLNVYCCQCLNGVQYKFKNETIPESLSSLCQPVV